MASGYTPCLTNGSPTVNGLRKSLVFSAIIKVDGITSSQPHGISAIDVSAIGLLASTGGAICRY